MNSNNVQAGRVGNFFGELFACIIFSCFSWFKKVKKGFLKTDEFEKYGSNRGIDKTKNISDSKRNLEKHKNESELDKDKEE